MCKVVGQRGADHIIGRLCGVKATDTPLEAARKAVELARMAGFSKRQMARIEALYEEAKRRAGQS